MAGFGVGLVQGVTEFLDKKMAIEEEARRRKEELGRAIELEQEKQKLEFGLKEKSIKMEEESKNRQKGLEYLAKQGNPTERNITPEQFQILSGNPYFTDKVEYNKVSKVYKMLTFEGIKLPPTDYGPTYSYDEEGNLKEILPSGVGQKPTVLKTPPAKEEPHSVTIAKKQFIDVANQSAGEYGYVEYEQDKKKVRLTSRAEARQLALDMKVNPDDPEIQLYINRFPEQPEWDTGGGFWYKNKLTNLGQQIRPEKKLPTQKNIKLPPKKEVRESKKDSLGLFK